MVSRLPRKRAAFCQKHGGYQENGNSLEIIGIGKKVGEIPAGSEFSSSNNNVFLMFNDQTNGDQTYSGGRYIDLNFKNSKRIEIDFNKAYNPYCEYDIKYTCPIPPKENKISIKILAGEKKYFD